MSIIRKSLGTYFYLFQHIINSLVNKNPKNSITGVSLLHTIKINYCGFVIIVQLQFEPINLA